MVGRFSVVAIFCSLPAGGAVTFYKDVLPIMQRHCQECHHAGEAVPMTLMTYKDARPWAAAIKEAVLTKKMPPWFAAGANGRFLNDRRLSQQEMDTLVSWAASGVKEGDAKDAPAPRAFVEGWSIGNPDIVFEMQKAFHVPPKGKVDYQYIVVPTGFTEDRWVSKIEVLPGNRSAVHHIVLIARAPGSNYMKAAKPGEPFAFIPENEAKHLEDTGAGKFFMLGGTVEMVSVYVPGGVAYQTAPGQARLIKAGSDLIFQMHYTPDGKDEMDKSRVGMVFAKEPPKERVVNTFIQNANLHIPPETSNHRVEANVTLYEDVTVTSLFPHMHVRGKSFEYKAFYPNGEIQTLLEVPHYDFNWQLSYYLKDPIKLPKGTRLQAIAHYDNSANNPNNPDPKKDVYWGEQTWDEMLAGFIDLAIPATTNPGNIVREKKPEAAKGGE